jgi:acyl-CoA reductase-like NAD-dependent aldehyde dehydrogenase
VLHSNNNTACDSLVKSTLMPRSHALFSTATHRPDMGSGRFVEPTCFVDVTNNMRIAQGGIFGPVLVVIPSEEMRMGSALPMTAYMACPEASGAVMSAR